MSPKETEVRRNSRRFLALCEAVLGDGYRVRVRAHGSSMAPNIQDGDVVEISPIFGTKNRKGDIALAKTGDGLRLHRIVRANAIGGVTRGDAGQENDLPSAEFIGTAVAIERSGRRQTAVGGFARAKHYCHSIIRRLGKAAARRIQGRSIFWSLVLVVGAAIGLIGSAQTASAQSADLALTQSVAPTTVAAGGTLTYTQTITNNGPNAAATATLAQQTPPNTTFGSMTAPAGWNCVTPGAGGTGQIRCSDTANLANGANATFTLVLNVNAGTPAGTQIQQSSNVTSVTADPDSSNNAALTTTNVEVAGEADLAVSLTASPAPVYVASTLTYNVTVQNLGLANATGSTLTDTLPGTATFVSATPSQGSCSQSAGVVTCALGTINANAAASVSIVITTQAAPSTISDTASVSSSLADPVNGNNSATVTSSVSPSTCSTPGKDGPGGTLTGIINTYYPPNGVTTLVAGSTSVALGASSGAGTSISVGDRLLIIQMQDADINSTQSGAYGDGIAGDPASGATNLRSAGQFEFVDATSAVPAGGGTLDFTGAGSGGGLLNSYESSAFVGGGAGHGQRTFQVIRVPQYSTATLSSSLTALGWNGSVGGVLALDASAQLTLGGTVSVDGLGFRGGAGRELLGGAGANTDYRTSAGVATNGSKGEGLAGTPRFLTNLAFTLVTDTGVEGYTNGSYARGAPGNAGGGGTDGNPVANNQNTGAGGGGNGGTGGKGGYGWSTSVNSGGFGGASFPAASNTVVLGGGGGAGTTNNGTADPPNGNPAGINSSGAAGGGIVMIHAGSIMGAGALTANGQSALNAQNDAGGGGGAGGSIIVLAASGNLGGLTVSANGGHGGSAWLTQAPGTYPGNRHGPGGGGGGGVILVSSTPASLSVAGGANGQTTMAKDAFGSTPGADGISATNVSSPLPGAQSGGSCARADLAVTNSGTPSVVTPGSNITYTQVVSNNGPQAAVNGVFAEAIPANTTFQSITVPAGWTCTTPAVGAAGNVSCTNPLVANGGSSTFTLVVQVNPGTTNQTQITDTASVSSGTVDPQLGNNSASVTTLVTSPGGSDLTVTNSGSPNPVAAGQNVTFTQSVMNAGPSPASSVSFTETVPANTTFFSLAPPGGWSCVTPSVGGTGTITCTISNLAAGASATFQPVFNVSAATASGTILSDTATISSATPDPNPSNNTATANVTVAGATQTDLAVTTSASPNPVLAGNNITFSQTVSNNGPNPALTNTFTETIPANTTFVSLGVPAGWTCTTPPVGGTGSISCTLATMTATTSAGFPLVVKVNTGTTPGTVISNNPAVSSATGDPNPANNSASASTVVASPSQADMSILKTASPEPVDQNTNLVYTLQIDNNGPATAQGVTVSDPLPAQVSFTSVSTTQGTCSQAGGTVTCNLGSMNPGALAIVTINVTASTFSSVSTASNTTTVSSTTSDPNLTNNSSTVVSTIQAPTAVQLVSFNAFSQGSSGVLLEWKTREEVRNLGFNVYRQDSSGGHRLNPSLIAGSALMLRGGHPQHAAKTYQWVDPQRESADATYWLEDVDLSAVKSQHGPAQISAAPSTLRLEASAQLLTHLNRAARDSALNQQLAPVAWPRQRQAESAPAENLTGEDRSHATNGTLDQEPAVKVTVGREGWYHINYEQLVSAGFNPDWNARNLQLFAEGVERPLLILGNQFGRLGPNDAIEFYGTGIDTPYSGTRVYWLIEGREPGKRISRARSDFDGSGEPSSFPYTSIREDRTTYFAALINREDEDNFFGAVVTSDPVDQDLVVTHSAPTALPVTLDITLQGATEGQNHSVSVVFNGSLLGNISFTGQVLYKSTFPVDASLLHDGTNTVTLTALDGDNDVSVVQSIVLHYAHTYAADGDWLRMEAQSGSRLHITGFSSPRIRVFDITNPQGVEQLAASIQSSSAGYSCDVAVTGSIFGGRTLVAFADTQIAQPEALVQHAPSHLTRRSEGGDILIVTHPDFVPALAPLIQLREEQGHRVKVATIDEVFDAYDFGERSPHALRSFLQFAVKNWRTQPQSILLVGDASLDPRNYLGFGDFDFVPTRLIDTAALKTASDDWFTDFTQTGFGTVPIGRLPVRSLAEAQLVVSKIVNYERGSFAGAWNSRALVVADQNIDANFTAASQSVAATLDGLLTTNTILSGNLDPQAARQQIISAINEGQLVVNYAGHGSVEQWSFSDLFDDSDAASLQNGNALPVFLIMDCLNGFFQDVYTQSLAESLLLSPNGGAVSVWASSGFTDAAPQGGMDRSLIAILAAEPSTPLGAAILQAKSQTTDPDVRRTWILFGDPMVHLHLLSSLRKTSFLRHGTAIPGNSKPN